MMNAVEYYKEQKRMCANYNYCNECPLAEKAEGDGFDYCTAWQRLYPEEAVRIVEEWSKEHPIQTRRAKFREVFGEEPTIKLVRAMSGYGVGENATVIMDLTEWWDAPYEAPKGEDE
jgi:hypothetical protein